MAQFVGILNTVAFILVGLIKLAGALLFGLGIGWLALDAYKKGQQSWQVQVAFFLGLIALLIASLRFAHIALGGLCLGMGIAFLIWGLPKKNKE